MEFFDLVPAFDFYKRRGSTFTRPEFAQEVVRQIKGMRRGAEHEAHEILRFQSEDIWTDLGRPYFKLWPEIIPTLTDVSVDVPADYLKLPYSTFLLRLPKTGSPLILDDEYQVRSLLVTEVDGPSCRFVYLWIDIGETEPTGLPMLHWHRLRCEPTGTIEESFGGKWMANLPGVRIPDNLAKRCLRLAVSVCFLSTGMDRLIEPDILSKDLADYIEARKRNDNGTVRTIEERAFRRKGPGWNVGQYERLRPLISASQQDGEQAGARGPLTHQHQRRAHFRLLSNGTVTFIRQATVRPDLPPGKLAPAYGVR